MNTQIDISYLVKFLPLIFTGLLSVIIGVYLEKFKNKLVILKYKLINQPIASTTQNDFWGNIEVTHNKRIVNYLSFVTLEIKNDSNKDIENVNVDVWVDKQSQILGVNGFYNESKNAILLEHNYYNYYNNVLNMIDEDNKLG